MSNPPDARFSFSAARRLGAGLGVIASVLALAAIVVMGNYLSSRHHERFHWTGDTRFELSPQTLRVLGAATNDVAVTVLFDREEALFPAVMGLLTEYAQACPRLKLEHVNYRRDPGRAQLVAARHQLASGESDLVIFELGGRHKIVRASELSDYDIAPLLAGQKEVKRSAFKGEPLFTGAIAALLQARQPVAYFLKGHGEHDPASENKLIGYTRFATLLQQKGIEIRPLNLASSAEVPEDCQLLIIAGPKSRIDPAELERLERYLQRGGRVLALLSFYQSQREVTGIEGLMDNWGIVVGNNYVLDTANSIRGNDVLVTNFTSQPIVTPLRGRRVHLLLPRSVMPKQGPAASALKPQPLFLTGPDGISASELSDGGALRTVAGKDIKGAIPLAVAVERGSIQGLGGDLSAARLLVVGESLFLGNEMILNGANLEFASLAINWLLDRPGDLAGLAARPLREYRIMLTKTQMIQLRWSLLAVFPGAVLLVGGLVWWRRRS
jgi:hypothetical protein